MVLRALCAAVRKIQHLPIRENVPGSFKPLRRTELRNGCVAVIVLRRHAAVAHSTVVFALACLSIGPCLLLSFVGIFFCLLGKGILTLLQLYRAFLERLPFLFVFLPAGGFFFPFAQAKYT